MQKTVKKYRKTLSSVGEKMAPCSQEFSVVNYKKRADRWQSFDFASLIYRAVKKSGEECPEMSGVNVNDPPDPGSEPYVSRASLQDDVR